MTEQKHTHRPVTVEEMAIIQADFDALLEKHGADLTASAIIKADGTVGAQITVIKKITNEDNTETKAEEGGKGDTE